MSNVIPLRPVDPAIVKEAKEELDDAVDSLIEAIRLFSMSGKKTVAQRVSAHTHALLALRLMA